MPSAARTLISIATAASWLPRSVSGNGVVSVTPVSALLISVEFAIVRVAESAYARSSTCDCVPLAINALYAATSSATTFGSSQLISQDSGPLPR